MAKVNKYLDAINKSNETFYSQLLTLGAKTKEAMEEAELLYTKEGARVKVQKIYDEAMQEAENLKQIHIDKLNYTLQVERGKLDEAKNLANNMTVEQQILEQLKLLNGFNTFKSELNSLETAEILDIANNNFLSKQKAAAIREVLTERAKQENNQELLVQARTIKAETNVDLINMAQDTVNSYNTGVWPGIPVNVQLHGGVETILNKPHLDELNNEFYFGNGEKEIK